MENVEKITTEEKVLAIIIRANCTVEKTAFFSPDNFPFQMGMHNRKAGDVVDPHQHKPFERLDNVPVQEFFYIIEGKVKVVLYNQKQPYKTVILSKGDMILLNCGHEITFLEETRLVEIKQGPYRGKDQEKEFIEKNS
jgi:quercetin dioxygenase-like cupin family protein